MSSSHFISLEISHRLGFNIKRKLLKEQTSLTAKNLFNNSQRNIEVSYSCWKELQLEQLIGRRSLLAQRLELQILNLSETLMTNLEGCICRLPRKWKMITMRGLYAWPCRNRNAKKLSVPNQPLKAKGSKEKRHELREMLKASLSLRYALKTMSNMSLTEILIKSLKNVSRNNARNSKKNWKKFMRKRKLGHWVTPQPELHKKVGPNLQLKNWK